MTNVSHIPPFVTVAHVRLRNAHRRAIAWLWISLIPAKAALFTALFVSAPGWPAAIVAILAILTGAAVGLAYRWISRAERSMGTIFAFHNELVRRSEREPV